MSCFYPVSACGGTRGAANFGLDGAHCGDGDTTFPARVGRIAIKYQRRPGGRRTDVGKTLSIEGHELQRAGTTEQVVSEWYLRTQNRTVGGGSESPIVVYVHENDPTAT